MASHSWPVVRKRIYPNGSTGWILDCRLNPAGAAGAPGPLSKLSDPDEILKRLRKQPGTSSNSMAA